MMSLPKYFVSCDWGTTNFRLKLVAFDSLEVVRETSSADGVKRLYQSFLEAKDTNQFDFFKDNLMHQLASFLSENETYPIVASGMISSSIGMYELPYANFPFDSSKESLVTQKLELNNDLKLTLISGIKNKSGVMRGEETQAIGLEDSLKNIPRGILLLPGTHSKHLTFKEGYFTDLKSFMTGELFEVISQKTILSSSIKFATQKSFDKDEFLRGVQLGLRGKLSSSLFSIRTKHLENSSCVIENYFFLSGLLIGDEIAYLTKKEETIVLACPESLLYLYEVALKSSVEKDRLVVIGNQDFEQAILIGQKNILKYDYNE